VHGDGVELGLVLVEAVDGLPRLHHLLGQRLEARVEANKAVSESEANRSPALAIASIQSSN
jgi:hypothetical protein